MDKKWYNSSILFCFIGAIIIMLNRFRIVNYIGAIFMILGGIFAIVAHLKKEIKLRIVELIISVIGCEFFVGISIIEKNNIQLLHRFIIINGLIMFIVLIYVAIHDIIKKDVKR